MGDDSLLEHIPIEMMRKEFFDLLHEETEIFMLYARQDWYLSIVSELLRNFGLERADTLARPMYDIWNTMSLEQFQEGISLLAAYRELSPLRAQVLKELQKRGICSTRIVHNNKPTVTEMKIISLLCSDSYKERGWTSLKFEVLNCTSRELLFEALQYLQRHNVAIAVKQDTMQSTAALMGKVVSAWKQRKMADGSNGVNAWHDIENMLKSMIAHPETPAYGWCQCLPLATAAELQQMLEFLENVN